MNFRIAIFTDTFWPRVNGVTVSVDTYSRALIRAKQKVIIVCPEYPNSTHITEDYPDVILIPSVPVFFSKEDRLAQWHKLVWLFKKLDEFEPQLLHINTEFIIAEFAMLYSKFRKIPIIYTFHTHWDVYIANYLPVIPAFIRRFIVRGILSKILSRSDTVIVPTIEARKILRQYNIGNKIQILPTGIDPAPFCYDTSKIKLFRQYMEKKFPVLRGKKLLLFAGRLTQEKNILFILKLLPCIIKRHSDIMLVISGDGPFALELRRQSKEIKIDKNCLFTGYMPHNELIWLYSMAYIFVFPSLTETQGLVTLEAMTAGIPVVAISSMGTKAVMAGGRGGFLVPNNPKIFTKKVLLLLENKKIYKIKAKEARRNAENWFIDIMVDRLLAIYRNTIIKTI